jgi:O-antigen ligase
MEQMTKNLFIPMSAVIITLLIFIGLTFGIALDFNLAIPIVLFGGIGLFILFRERPLTFLALLIIARMSLDYSSQFVSISVRDYNLSLSQILGLAIAILGLYIIYLYRERQKHFVLTTPFLLLIVWGVLTLSYSISLATSLTEIIRIFDLYVIALLGFIFVRTTKQFQTLLLALLFSSVIPGLVALYQYFNHIGFSDADVSIPRIFGTFAHPNTLSLYLFALLIVWLLYRCFVVSEKSSSQFSLFLYGGLGIILILLFLTFARVAWLATLIFVFVFSFFRYPKLLIPLILIPLFLLLVSTPFQDRLRESFSPDPDSSIVWRQTLWSDVITKNLQDERLLLGSGINTFPLFTDTIREGVSGSNDAHNDFVKFFIEGGLLGLGILIAFYSWLVIILLQIKKRTSDRFLKDALFIMLLFTGCLFIASLTDNVFKNTPVQWIYFVLLGALISLTKQGNIKKEKTGGRSE